MLADVRLGGVAGDTRAGARGGGRDRGMGEEGNGRLPVRVHALRRMHRHGGGAGRALGRDTQYTRRRDAHVSAVRPAVRHARGTAGPCGDSLINDSAVNPSFCMILVRED